MIHQMLQEVNKAFFIPRSMKLDLLKNCPETIPTIVQWLYDEWSHYDASLTKEKLVHSFNQRLNTDKIPITFVALREGIPIGTISLRERSDPELSDFDEDSIWIGSLQILPEERHHGLGQELLQFAATVAKNLGHRELYFYTSNPLNVEWYVERGANIIEKRPFRKHTITIMRLPLTSSL
jgi:GNAT superfamily N-acetyltransferase